MVHFVRTVNLQQRVGSLIEILRWPGCDCQSLVTWHIQKIRYQLPPLGSFFCERRHHHDELDPLRTTSSVVPFNPFLCRSLGHSRVVVFFDVSHVLACCFLQ